MGERGTRSAREIASIVLLDDNFRTIVRAIAQGRQLFHNLQLSFAYLLMIHIPLVITAALVPLAGYPLLYLPIHIVWLELIIHPTALLVFQELPTSDRLRRIQHHPRLRFFTPQEWLIIGLVGLLVTAVVAGGYERSLGLGRDVEHARAMALVALTVASATLTASLTDLRTWASCLMVLGTVGTTWLFVQTPMLAARLHLKPLHLDDWVAAVAGSLLAAGLAVLIRLGRRS
jgi:Ca2+-transporting ATPase